MRIMHTAAAVAGKSFFSPLLSYALLLAIFCRRLLDSFSIFLIGQVVFSVIFSSIFVVQHRGNPFHISIVIRSLLLGIVFTIGFHVALLGVFYDDQPYSSIQLSSGLYFVILTIFHFSEFLITAINQHNVTTEAFLLNHSREYHLALTISLIEFAIESYFIPDVKFYFPLLIKIGFGICLICESIRKVAMFTAGQNFTHIIADEHQPEHFLVTTGIYGIWRHPSYVGWFYWSIGTQILLLNPVSFIGYCIVSWRFFKLRIYYEERTLTKFFGAKYIEYKQTVPTGLPFIDGF